MVKEVTVVKPYEQLLNTTPSLLKSDVFLDLSRTLFHKELGFELSRSRQYRATEKSPPKHDFYILQRDLTLVNI